MEIQKAYQEQMGAKLKEWSAQINLLESKIESAGAEMRVKRAEQLHELRAKQHAAADKMKELGRASGEAWEQAKVTADKLWEDLKVGVADAHAKFK